MLAVATPLQNNGRRRSVIDELAAVELLVVRVPVVFEPTHITRQ